jgi:hypothetical protein
MPLEHRKMLGEGLGQRQWQQKKQQLELELELRRSQLGRQQHLVLTALALPLRRMGAERLKIPLELFRMVEFHFLALPRGR